MDPPIGQVYVAMYDWEARDSVELSFKKGEKLEIKEEYTDGWWLARSLDTDQEGFVYTSNIEKDKESVLLTLEPLKVFHYTMTKC
uniref:SH3 domain-containing protein n=1 Tax=Amphimedon queenslandica TaxID=400682 RepID=A0A1X7SZB5_AMPQE